LPFGKPSLILCAEGQIWIDPQAALSTIEIEVSLPIPWPCTDPGMTHKHLQIRERLFLRHQRVEFGILGNIFWRSRK
jgi:hypothetical protein